jgi:Flp pilus assembly protein TadD
VPSVESENQATRRQLERLLESRLFARSEQLSRFLRFLVEQHLEGLDRDLKESVIGVEVFGRKTDYNPKFDPIVRTEARRLRARLREYYQGEGKGDTLLIELPKGGYVPTICSVAPGKTGAQRAPMLKPARYRLWAGIGVGLIALVLAVVGLARSVPDNRLHTPTTQSATNSQAYALYIRARALEMLPAFSGIEDSLGLFEQAIAKDPSFAPGYAGIAAGYAARSGFDRFDAAERAEMIAKGWAAAERAVELNPLSPDAQDGLGTMQAREAQWGLAERSFRRAIELAPGDLLWRDHFALFLLLPLGRIEEALGQLHSAEEIDTAQRQTHNALSIALRAAGRFDEAEFHCRKAAANDQERGACWAQTLLRQGDAEQAVRILEATWNGHLLEPGAQSLGIAYARAGRRKDAERIAALVPRYASKTQIFAALGDKERTFKMLELMIPTGPTRIGRDFLISPNFAFLRGDPRLRTLRRKVGLPE